MKDVRLNFCWILIEFYVDVCCVLLLFPSRAQRQFVLRCCCCCCVAKWRKKTWKDVKRRFTPNPPRQDSSEVQSAAPALVTEEEHTLVWSSDGLTFTPPHHVTGKCRYFPVYRTTNEGFRPPPPMGALVQDCLESHGSVLLAKRLHLGQKHQIN